MKGVASRAGESGKIGALYTREPTDGISVCRALLLGSNLRDRIVLRSRRSPRSGVLKAHALHPFSLLATFSLATRMVPPCCEEGASAFSN
jgi:hypothetical protein